MSILSEAIPDEFFSWSSAQTVCSPAQVSNDFVAVDSQIPVDMLPHADMACLDPDMFSYFMMPPMPVEPMTFNSLPLDFTFPSDSGAAFEYPAFSDPYPNNMNMFTSSYNSPSPTPTLRIESPFASFHSSSTPPHTPTCLPLSIVAPSPAPFYLDTSAPQQQPATEVAFTSPILAPASPKSVSLLRTVKKTAILKKAASPSGLRPLTFQDFKASPSPIAHSLLDDSTVEPVSPVSEVASEPSNPDKSPAPPSITTTSSSRSSKKSSSASQGTKKRHILQEWETEVLNKCFEQNQFLVSEQAKDLSARLGMTVNQVRIWFQNKRAFVKRQMSKNSNMTEDDD